jgi:hypothetical protein
MFVIESRQVQVEAKTVGKWFEIWYSPDGPDSAGFLKELVELEPSPPTRQYKMTYRPYRQAA